MKASKDGPKLNLRLLHGKQKDDEKPQVRAAGAEPTLRRETPQDKPAGAGAGWPAGVAAAPVKDDSPPPPSEAQEKAQEFAFDPEKLGGSGRPVGPAGFPSETEFPASAAEPSQTPSFLTQASPSEAAGGSADRSGPVAEQQKAPQSGQESEAEAETAKAKEAAGANDETAAEKQRARKELRALRRQRVEAKALALAEAKEEAGPKTGKADGQGQKRGGRQKGKPRAVPGATLPAVGKNKKVESEGKDRKQDEKQPTLAPAQAKIELLPKEDATPEVAPATPVNMIGQGLRLVVGFFRSLLVLALIVGPMLLAGYYYFFVAAERYEVRTVFLIRTAGAETPTVTTILGQSQSFGRAADESFSVVDYVTSYEGLVRLEDLVDLRAAYSKPEDDPFFYLPADSTLLDLHAYYLRMVDAYYDQITGLVTIDVRAFSPEDSYAIAQALLAESERLVNEFNTRAQEDLLQLARQEVADALSNLEDIERQLTAFRQENNVIDPMEVITRVNGIIAALEGEIAKAEAELVQLSKVTGNRGGVARLELEARIEALRIQVERERQRLVGQQESLGTLIPEFELLGLRKELAGQAYSAALASMQSSVAQAQRQQLYVVPVVAPTKLDQAQLPDRWESLFFVFLVVLLIFTVGRLLILGIRDHIL